MAKKIISSLASAIDWVIFFIIMGLTMIKPDIFSVVFMLVSILLPVISSNASLCILTISLNVAFALVFSNFPLPTLPGMVFRLIMFIILIFGLFFQLIHLCALVSNYEVSEESTAIKGNLIIKFVLFFGEFIDEFTFKLARILPIISYMVLTITIIVGFSYIYSTQNDFYASQGSGDGYYQSVPGSDIPVRIPPSDNNDVLTLVDNIYFSTVTFYTVGYGDTEIYGTIPKITVQLEMILSNILLVIFLPLSFRYLASPSPVPDKLKT